MGHLCARLDHLRGKECELDHPVDVCSRPDDKIAVVDSLIGHVVVYDKERCFVKIGGSPSRGPWQFINRFSRAAGGGGEMIVLDSYRRDIQVFDPEGELLQIIGPKGNSKVAWDTL